MSAKNVSQSASTGCAVLFLLPFLIAGLGALSKGIYDFSNDPRFTEDVLALFGVGTMFTLVGGGMLAGVIWAARKEKELDQKKAQHPDAPWLWRDDWAEGRVKPATPGGMFVYWLFGIVFSAVSVPIMFALDEILGKGPLGYAVFLFPLVGVCMLLAAVYATLRWFKYGQTWCDLVTNPGIVGGWFRAVIWAKVPLTPQDTVNVTLTCFHRYTSGTGKNRTTHRKVTWQETLQLGREHLATEADGMVAIPVRFYIPRSCTPSTPGWPTDRMEWELKAAAEVAGIDFVTDFIVPVFMTEDSSDVPPDESELASLPAVTPEFRPSILVLEGVDSTEFHAPPRRNPGALLGFTLFAVIWTGIIAGMAYSGEVPILFPVVFGLFDILILSATLWMWFGHARVRFEHGNATVSRKVLGIGPETTFPLSEVTGADMHITMQSGNTPYYTIRLHTTSGKKSTVGGIREKAEAKAIVRRIEGLLDTAS